MIPLSPNPLSNDTLCFDQFDSAIVGGKVVGLIDLRLR